MQIERIIFLTVSGGRRKEKEKPRTNVVGTRKKE